MHLGLVIVEELLFPRLIDHALKALLMVKMDMKLQRGAYVKKILGEMVDPFQLVWSMRALIDHRGLWMFDGPLCR